MKKTDLRVIKTKNLLYTTILDLMKDKPFEEIRVSDICNKALINRSTFYTHYTDKYELLSELINNLKNNLKIELEKNESIKNLKDYYLKMLELLLNHIDEEKETYLSIMINNRNSITMDILNDVIDKDINERLKLINNPNTKIPSSIISKFYLGAVISVCLEWLTSNNKYQKQDIINYFNLLIPDNVN